MRTAVIAAFLAAAMVTDGCSTSPRFASREREREKAEARESSGPANERIVRTPPDRVLLTLEGIASYYADDFHGKLTSNGEVYDMHDLTAAHRNFPFHTKVRVTNLDNNRSVVVRINDRGPFKEGRIIDLSLGAAKEIDLIQKGTARVRLEVLEWGDGTLIPR